MMISPAEFASRLDVPRETMEKLQTYADLLEKWQKAKNLVSGSTIANMWQRHFLDSAQLFPLVRKIYGSRPLKIMDIGSGAGFPGLVLAIMGLGQSHMVEANGRKCSFMAQVTRETKASAVIHNERIEALPAMTVDIITSRACARVLQLLSWASPFISKNTEMWLLKGEGVDDELTEAQTSWNMDIEKFNSLSDPSGVIVRLTNIKRK